MQNIKIAVIGLGYVGLPLAVEFSKYFKVLGFDQNKTRVFELQENFDKTKQVTKPELIEQKINFSYQISDLKSCNFFIICVPTPIDKNKNPDLSLLKKASKTVALTLQKNSYVVYESTVYPGATEEIFLPILEKYSTLKAGDFFLGYSPERVNPSDNKNTIAKTIKLVSALEQKSAQKIASVYKQILKNPPFVTSSIKVAEAAKVIENTQRDINIAFVNELAIIFKKLKIDTKEVLDAAATKWNFIKFMPGLVGGHCIGVDPYYLTQKALSIGYHPDVILTGRKINDSMPEYIIKELILEMIKKEILIKKSRLLILGFTFKENCPDIRNSKVFDLVIHAKKFALDVDIHEPLADNHEAKKDYNLSFTKQLSKNTYDAILVAVAHEKFIEKGINYYKQFAKKNHVVFDIKSIFNIQDVDARL